MHKSTQVVVASVVLFGCSSRSATEPAPSVATIVLAGTPCPRFVPNPASVLANQPYRFENETAGTVVMFRPVVIGGVIPEWTLAPGESTPTFAKDGPSSDVFGAELLCPVEYAIVRIGMP